VLETQHLFADDGARSDITAIHLAQRRCRRRLSFRILHLC
jgi:hypothetical protein